jgi:ComF family protein
VAKKLFDAMLAALFPDYCTVCEVPVFADSFLRCEKIRPPNAPEFSKRALKNSGDRAVKNLKKQWCADCWQELALESRLQCNFCGAEMRAANPLGGGCWLCRNARLRFDRAICLGNYDGLLRDLVIQMKNQHIDDVAVRLAHLIAWKLSQQFWTKRIDLIVPVPTFWKRRLKRGFCAAELLAETIAKDIGVKASRSHVRFIRQTEKQGRLSITKRRKNIVGALEMNSRHDIRDKIILIVDDVMTSGATVSELAKVLKKNGAAAVFVAVVARGAGVR